MTNSHWSTKGELEEEEKVWAQVRRENTMEAYDRFLADPRNRLHREEARRRVAMLLRAVLLREPDNMIVRRRYIDLRDDRTRSRDGGYINWVFPPVIGTLLGASLGWLLGVYVVTILYVAGGTVTILALAVKFANRRSEPKNPYKLPDAADVILATPSQQGHFIIVSFLASFIVIGTGMLGFSIVLRESVGSGGGGAILMGIPGGLAGFFIDKVSIYGPSRGRWRYLLGPLPKHWMQQPDRLQQLSCDLKTDEPTESAE